MCKYLVYIVDHQRSPGIHEVTRRWQLAFGECRKYIQQKLLAKRNEDPGWTIGMIRRGWQGAGGRVFACGEPGASETHDAEGDGRSSNARKGLEGGSGCERAIQIRRPGVAHCAVAGERGVTGGMYHRKAMSDVG